MSQNEKRPRGRPRKTPLPDLTSTAGIELVLTRQRQREYYYAHKKPNKRKPTTKQSLPARAKDTSIYHTSTVCQVQTDDTLGIVENILPAEPDSTETDLQNPGDSTVEKSQPEHAKELTDNHGGRGGDYRGGERGTQKQHQNVQSEETAQEPTQKRPEGRKRLLAVNSTCSKKERFLLALRSALGNTTEACKKVPIDRTEVYRWRDNDPKFQRELAVIDEEINDYLRTLCLVRARAGSDLLLIFYMKSRMPEFRDGPVIEIDQRSVNVNGKQLTQVGLARALVALAKGEQAPVEPVGLPAPDTAATPQVEGEATHTTGQEPDGTRGNL